MAKLSNPIIPVTTDLTDGLVHMIVPDETSETGYTSKKIVLEDHIQPGGIAVWGEIEGTIQDQTDLIELIPDVITNILDMETTETDDSLVLAPDGEGGVEWRAESVGSTVIPYFDASIGAGGDYADIATAQSAGKYKLKAVGNITVSGNTTITNPMTLDLSGFTMACATYNFTFSGSGRLRIENGTITFAYGSTGKLFVCATNNDIYVNNCTITNSSTIAGAFISAYGIFINSFIGCPNYGYCGFGGSGSSDYWNGKLINITITTGGANCIPIWTVTGIGSVVSLLISVTISTISIFGTNIYLSSSGSVYGQVSNFYGTSATLLTRGTDITLGNIGSITSQSIVRAAVSGNMSLGNTYGLNHFTTILFAGSITIALGSDSNTFTDCRVGTTTSITGDYNKFIGCTFVGAVTINSGAEYNIFIGCIFTGGLTNNSGNTTNIIENNI